MGPAVPKTLQPTWAATTFSFTTELVTGEHSPNEIVESLGGVPAIEAVELDGFQHFRSFPDVDEAEADEFRRLVSETGLKLIELGVYNDLVESSGRVRDLDWQATFLETQIRSAARLGFTRTKVMFGLDPELQRRLERVLDETGIRLLQEVQGKLTPSSPALDEQRSFAAARPDHFGFVFDLSATMHGVPVTFLDFLGRRGVPREAIRLISEDWAGDHTDTTKDAVVAILDRTDIDPLTRRQAMTPFTRFGNSRVKDFREFLTSVEHIHLKYWDLEDAGGIVSEPICDLRRELDLVAYDGAVTSEWGGHEWIEDATGLEMTEKHLDLARSVWLAGAEK
ncbi:MAG TPA: hypothetical protein VNT50_01835 [Microbacterium sp.]|uniref:hypothetical protein n=1 Tax=Microbacterium sp. TaxID=51671 RepID=UPI002BCAB04E|nr:hypothetical protein [Microbacterium sp.]HWI30206.1 hypothetical protein [Microbacterium sp.]